MPRWTSLGVEARRIVAVGSIKFDPENVAARPEVPRAILESLGVSLERPILLAGSTHPGEEQILARVFLQLRGAFPSLFLIVAPRHVERSREIETSLQALGISSLRRSQNHGSATADCLLLDSTGELRDWYSIATVVFIGKSLTTRGGQNPVEAIVAGRPVVYGPHMENFAALADALVRAGGALQIADETALTRALTELLGDGEKREQLVRHARDVLNRHRGATERTARLLETMVARRP